MPEFVYAPAEKVHAFAVALLTRYDVPEDDAVIVADCLVRADLRGVDTHGVARLPKYLERLRLGLVNKRPDLKPVEITPVAAALDGQNGFGFLVATRAMDKAMDMARRFGIGIVSARRSTHFGMAASYVLQAVEQGFVALVFTNASPAMPPWGGREALLGTSPFAAGAPGEGNARFVLDMAPSLVARGKIRRALTRGERIPDDWALDGAGQRTTDPARALEGVMLPMGGPKGSGLSMLMDIFGGVLSGAAYAGGVGDQYKVFDRPQDVGHFFLAMKPDLFVPLEEYRARMKILADRVHGAPLAEGFDEVLMPGEPEARQEAQRRRSGIPYSPNDLAALQAEAEKLGLKALEVSAKPLGA
jgi:LDH2 family malate/lactate/ureidoglycolate dehydrogenase